MSLEDTIDWFKKKPYSFLHSIAKPRCRLLFELRAEAKYCNYAQAQCATMSSSLPPNQEPVKGNSEVMEDEVAEWENRATLEESFRSADLVIATGGGIMCDHAKRHAPRVLDTLEAAIQLGKPAAMAGQQMGLM